MPDSNKPHPTQSTHAQPIKNSRSELRNELRRRRQALSIEQQLMAGESLCKVLQSQLALLSGQNVAVYLSNDGEINPEAWQQHLWQTGVNCYLPVVGSDRQLSFALYSPDTPLKDNRFGIPEPEVAGAKTLLAKDLDVVFVPLTGFDLQGQRLGMGGGFYDHTFAFLRTVNNPILIGLAHECQKVDSIPTETWDIPMAGIATDAAFYPV